jgi:predicted signal transduction protein with EAL and GGDEF domain
VKRIAVDARSRAIVAAIIDLAHALDLTVVGEGVETQAQLLLLRGFGCDLGQGHLFARSLTASGLVGFLDDGAASHLVFGGERRWISRSDLAHGAERTADAEMGGARLVGSHRNYSTTRSRRLGI